MAHQYMPEIFQGPYKNPPVPSAISLMHSPLLSCQKISENQNNKGTEDNVFWLIKNKGKIVGNHLKLYYYHKNKEQKLVIMYLELFFNGIKSKSWKVAEVSKIAYLGIEAGRKDCLCRD